MSAIAASPEDSELGFVESVGAADIVAADGDCVSTEVSSFVMDRLGTSVIDSEIEEGSSVATSVADGAGLFNTVVGNCVGDCSDIKSDGLDVAKLACKLGSSVAASIADGAGLSSTVVGNCVGVCSDSKSGGSDVTKLACTLGASVVTSVADGAELSKTVVGNCVGVCSVTGKLTSGRSGTELCVGANVASKGSVSGKSSP